MKTTKISIPTFSTSGKSPQRKSKTGSAGSRTASSATSAKATSAVSKKPSGKPRRPSTISQWTEEEVKILRKLYPVKSAKTISEILNRSRTAVSSKANHLKIQKADDWATNPEAKRFFKGHMHALNRKPHNKGKKRNEYLSPAQIEKIKETQFKKGIKPSHTMPVGTIITRTNNLRKTYQFIKISEMKWIFLHHKIWIDSHGEIPKGHVIVFKDKDTMNVKLENLQMISKEQHCHNNRDSKYPMELREVIRLKNKLKKEAWQRTKSNT